MYYDRMRGMSIINVKYYTCKFTFLMYGMLLQFTFVPCGVQQLQSSHILFSISYISHEVSLYLSARPNPKKAAREL